MGAKTMFVVVVVLLALGVAAEPSFQYGYLPEKNNSLFYALYPVQNAPEESPLVMWLQGGPGGSSLFGDFLENGPVDVNGKVRTTAWTNGLAHLLYVDNPAGVGWSKTDEAGFATSDDEIADKLVDFLGAFFVKYPAFQTRPFWIATESYGGKMTAVTGMALHKAIQAGQVKADFKGVALGDGWLAPVDCMRSYSPYLLAQSLLDEEEAAKAMTYADAAAAALAADNGVEATNQWGLQQEYIEKVCDECNFYNAPNISNANAAEAQLGINMAPGGSFYEQVKSGLPAGYAWGSQSSEVFSKLSNAFMRPAVYAVEYLLDAGLQTYVYSGQLDIIVDALCTETWVNNMTWSGLAAWQQEQEQFMEIDGITEAFYRTYQNFGFFKILRAGHMVPFDNGPAAYKMMQMILQSSKK